MAVRLGKTTLVNLAKIIVDKLESFKLLQPLSSKDEKLLLDYTKAIAEKDEESLTYLLTKI